jgi:Asp-tRNA(Asn)/Glu-tRNA(Gln) amidotransferase A subunit family amidase
LYAGPGPSLAALTGKPRIRDGVTQASATELARAIRDGSLSSVEAAEACLQRIDALNGTLNAIVRLDPERAIAAAQRADEQLAKGAKPGALHGVPITIKDSLAGDLPIGVQIVARPWREDVALAVAAHLENALGGFVPPAM